MSSMDLAYARTAVPSHKMGAQSYSIGTCVWEDVASSSSAEAYVSMPNEMVSAIMQVDGLLCRISDPENESRDDKICDKSEICAGRMHEGCMKDL